MGLQKSYQNILVQLLMMPSKKVKRKELDKLLSVLFLRNANHGRFGELLVEYRKSFANKDNYTLTEFKSFLKKVPPPLQHHACDGYITECNSFELLCRSETVSKVFWNLTFEEAYMNGLFYILVFGFVKRFE